MLETVAIATGANSRIRAWDPLKATKGSVVLMAGNAAEIPTASAAALGVINAAIVALAKAFAERGFKDGIQVNSVFPGPVMSGRRLSMIEKWPRYMRSASMRRSGGF